MQEGMHPASLFSVLFVLHIGFLVDVEEFVVLCREKERGRAKVGE